MYVRVQLYTCMSVGQTRYPSTEGFHLFIESGVVIGLEPSEPDYDQ